MQAEDPRTPERVASCGWYARRGEVELRQRGSNVYVAQLLVCGRAWVEAVCSAKIRTRKGTELSAMIEAHTGKGGGISLLTATSGEHHADDPLTGSLALLRKGWTGMLRTETWRKLRDRHGLMGVTIAYEFTYGAEGWHPHIHALLWHREPWAAEGIAALEIYAKDFWRERVITPAGRYFHPVHGVRIDYNANAAALGGYVAKVQESDWGPAQELTRGDAKTARGGKGRTPFRILSDHYRTGDLADWRLWQEYTEGVKIAGERSIPLLRSTPGLRAEILGAAAEPVLTDEQLALVEVGGELLAVLAWRVWVRVRQAHAVSDLLAAGEAGGLDGVNALLAERGLGQADPP